MGAVPAYASSRLSAGDGRTARQGRGEGALGKGARGHTSGRGNSRALDKHGGGDGVGWSGEAGRAVGAEAMGWVLVRLTSDHASAWGC